MENKTGITDEQLEKAAEKHSKAEIEEVTETVDYSPSEIFNVLKLNFIAGAKYILSHSVDAVKENNKYCEREILYQSRIKYLEEEISKLSVDRGREAQDFAEWSGKNYTLLHSKELNKSAWVSLEVGILVHGSDFYYTNLINEKGKTTEQLYQEYINQLSK